jgi:biopolymer transport protein ExbB/TolQ
MFVVLAVLLTTRETSGVSNVGKNISYIEQRKERSKRLERRGRETDLRVQNVARRNTQAGSKIRRIQSFAESAKKKNNKKDGNKERKALLQFSMESTLFRKRIVTTDILITAMRK